MSVGSDQEEGKVRECKTRHDKSGQAKIRKDLKGKTRQDKTREWRRQENAREGMRAQGKT